MPVPESTLDALRAFLKEDSDGLDRAMARMQRDGTADAYARLLASAMVELLQRRLGNSPTLSEIVTLVARLRADHRINDELDVHPGTTEKLIRAAYGDTKAVDGLDQQELADIQAFLVTTLAADEQLDEARREELVAAARRRADASSDAD